MNKPAHGVASSEQTVLLCRVRSRLCGLPLSAVEETLRPQPVRPLAARVPHVQGLARIRGGWSPVLDLAGLLGLGHAAVGRYVVVRAGERRVALAVSEVLGLRHLPPGEVERLPSLLQDDSHAAVSALAERDGELIAILDEARLMPALEDGWDGRLLEDDPELDPAPDSSMAPTGDLAEPPTDAGKDGR